MHLARKIKKVEADFFKRMRTFLKTGFFSLEKKFFSEKYFWLHVLETFLQQTLDYKTRFNIKWNRWGKSKYWLLEYCISWNELVR